MEYIFGIDVGGTSIKAGLFDLGGELLEKYEIPTVQSEGGTQILDDIASLIGDILEKQGTNVKDSLRGIGIDIPGPVANNHIVGYCANLNWDMMDVVGGLQERLGIQDIVLLNDANAAALGEIWKGSGSEFNSLVMVTLGTGVGGGIVIEGHVLTGTFGSAGEIGHIYAGGDAPCGCGKVGCLETFSSATGIVRVAKEQLAAASLVGQKSTASLLESINPLTAKDVFDAAKEGDSVALETARIFGEKLGIALGQIACVVDPDVFVIGGGVSKAGDFLIDFIREPYKKYTYHASRETEFRIASLGNDAGMYGAARSILQRIE